VKKIVIVPTLLTLGNAVCGFAAIVVATKVDPANPETAVFIGHAAWLIFVGMIFDALDGYAARLSKTASEFGGQLDSLCDAVSFGVAPAFLLWRMTMVSEQGVWHSRGVLVVGILYMCCAIMRLARFNVENNPDPAYHKRFKGLPSPAAAGCVASLGILYSVLPRYTSFDTTAAQSWVSFLAPVGTFVVALLMVSRFSFPHMTKQLLRGPRSFGYVVQLILLVGLVVVTREITITVLFWGYALILPLRQLAERAVRPEQPVAPPVDEVLRRG
jgi:CDP-diacylglycerol--serine O-phosphatidyltransferase